MKIILKTLLIVVTVASAVACRQSDKSKSMITKELQGVHKGKEVFLFTLTNSSGNVLKLSSFGARITWIEVPDRNGVKDNVTFGFDTFNEMIAGDPYFGSVVGRYANRIAKGKFTLDRKEYSLSINNGVNSLHGGPGGWHSAVWDSEIISVDGSKKVKFSLKSPDMEEGYPGNMEIETLYSWTDSNEIVIEYKCITDSRTVLNITNHAYFNLGGAGNGDILGHEVVLRASKIVAVDSTLIPTGELRPVAGTPFDFTTPHTVGERINEDYDQLKLGNGYDHTFILDNVEEPDATVYDKVSGRFMEVFTDEPGIQFYTGNFLNGTVKGHGGKTLIHRSGLCLETGHYPDSPNHPEFPVTVLNPQDTYISKTVYRFSVK
jgi:aldose 1-epimerase